MGAAAGAGAYGYYQGNSVAAYGAEFGATYQATKQALADLALPIRHEHHQGLVGEIESSIEDGTRITITLEEKPRMTAAEGHQTDVTIRVGLWGDSKMSNKLQQQISQHVLQKNAQQPSPNRLPPIGNAPGIQQTQAVTPATNNLGWKPAVPGSNSSNVPPP